MQYNFFFRVPILGAVNTTNITDSTVTTPHVNTSSVRKKGEENNHFLLYSTAPSSDGLYLSLDVMHVTLVL